jgi:peptide/nickel transport system permease protein
MIAAVAKQLGLNGSPPLRYWRWLWSAVHGNLGDTVNGQSVTQLIGTRIVPTAELGLLSVVISLIVAILLAVWAYRTRSRRARAVVEAVQSTFLIVPGFWLGILLVLAFAVELRWLPSSGYVPFSDSPSQNIRDLVLPLATLSLPQIALYFRYLLAGLEAQARSPYVVAARARGISEHAVTYHHVLPNGVLPTVTIVGIYAAGLASGIVVVEEIFSWPGLGLLLVQSIQNKDANTLNALVLFTAAAFVFISMFVDIAYGLLDPRLRRSSS